MLNEIAAVFRYEGAHVSVSGYNNMYAVHNAYDTISRYLYHECDKRPDTWRNVRVLYHGCMRCVCKSAGVNPDSIAAFLDVPTMVYNGIDAQRCYDCFMRESIAAINAIGKHTRA